MKAKTFFKIIKEGFLFFLKFILVIPKTDIYNFNNKKTALLKSGYTILNLIFS